MILDEVLPLTCIRPTVYPMCKLLPARQYVNQCLPSGISHYTWVGYIPYAIASSMHHVVAMPLYIT